MCVPCVHHLSNCPLQVLQERLGVRCLLGLTATATHATALSVGQHLRVNEDSIIRGHMLPDNLHISVSCDQDRDQVGFSLSCKYYYGTACAKYLMIQVCNCSLCRLW